ncbi:MAG: 3-isopropylmalate dehydrogenase [Alistipes sp.]|nr:3-isopropylmalate dehydrogenase [Alistipes sp.]
MKHKIAVLPGDGIGPEIVAEAVGVLESVAARFGHEFEYAYAAVGAAAIDECGDPYPAGTDRVCRESDAILFGAIGDPKYDNDPTAKVRPEQGLLRMRRALGLYANLRPVKLHAPLTDRSPLRREVVEGTDFVCVRELTGGIYFGERGLSADGLAAFDTCTYTRGEVERIVRMALELAMKRRRKLTVVDKANVLETSRLWRETARALAAEYPAVEVDYMFVDNAAMQLVTRPSVFDVVVTENMFGDILTDEASVIGGSLGMLPSASVGDGNALFEPIHGSYPQAAGRNIANPMATILSAAMMLEHLGLDSEGAAIREAVEKALEQGIVSEDLVKKGDKAYSTSGIGSYICSQIQNSHA